MKVRSVRFFGATERQRIEGELRAAVTDWSQGWFRDHVATVSRIEFLREAGVPSGDMNLGASSGKAVVANFKPLSFETFFGNDRTERSGGRFRLEEELTRRAVRDLVESVVGRCEEQGYEQVAYGGNGCGVVLAVDGHSIGLFFNGACFAREPVAVPQSEKLMSPRQVLERTGAGTRVELALGSASLSLRELAQLRMGDVVKLDTPLSAMVKLVSGSPQVEMVGHLGNHKGHRAMKMAKNA